MSRGKLIVFEGLNGCGKGTQMAMLHNYIQSLGKAVPIFSTGEPTELNDWGAKAREMLKSDGNPYSNGILAVKYFAKNRLEHNNFFIPFLNKGVNILCDRYYYSNLAYQHAQGIPYEEIAEANKNAIRPDLTFILNTTPEESARRLKLRDGEQGRKFDFNLEFNKKVWDNYMEFGKILTDLMGDKSIVYIDGIKETNEVFQQIKKIYHSGFD